jgi:hypothetical protein
MASDDIGREVIEKVRVQSLVSKSIIARDSGHWEMVAACYHPKATLTTSWFTGTPAEFVEGSRNMKIARHPGESQKHMTSNFAVEVKGTRAVSECDLILYQRRLIEGIEFDLSTWSRRLDLAELVDGEWKMPPSPAPISRSSSARSTSRLTRRRSGIIAGAMPWSASRRPAISA